MKEKNITIKIQNIFFSPSKLLLIISMKARREGIANKPKTTNTISSGTPIINKPPFQYCFTVFVPLCKVLSSQNNIIFSATKHDLLFLTTCNELNLFQFTFVPTKLYIQGSTALSGRRSDVAPHLLSGLIILPMNTMEPLWLSRMMKRNG